MKEGSVFIVIDFPEKWPPIEKSTILFTKKSNIEISIIGHIDGSIEISIDGETERTQCIGFTEAHRAILSFIWNEKKQPYIEIYMNGKKLNSHPDKEKILITSSYELEGLHKIYSESEMKDLCIKWMKWRKHHYSIHKLQAKNEREVKPISEQIAELQASITSLKVLLENFSSDKLLLTINVLPLLRALLFWPDKKGNYNPLLIRIAAFYDLALPIYALKDRIKNTKNEILFRDSTIHRVYNFPSTVMKHKNEVLMDFQEWLNMECIKRDNHKTYRWKDLIFDAANTSSSAHFDDDKLIYIDELFNTISWDKTDIENYILAITITTIELGEFVLNKCR